MLLDARLEGVVEVRGQQYHNGRPYFEASLVSEDGQTLHLFEGQLKEVDEELEVGGRYRVTFRPFINNRWVELKVDSLEPAAESPPTST